MAEIRLVIEDKLYQDGADVFHREGTDVATAVRMFFRESVRRQRIPFDEKPSGNGYVNEYARSMIEYQSPVNDAEDAIVVIPLEKGFSGPEVSVPMYAQMVKKIPAGKISCWRDINLYLMRLYGITVPEHPQKTLIKYDADGRAIPYWRLVTENGQLRWNEDKAYLETEGVPVVQVGIKDPYFKVPDFKKYLFDFGTLKVVKAE